MANYKEILGKKFKEGMTAEEVLNLLEKIDLGNLADGSYIAKKDYDAKEGELEKLQKELKAFEEKARENLSGEEKTKYEIQELTKSLEAQKAELERYKLKDAIMKNGFSADECDQILSAQDKGENVASVYANIIKERTEAAVKSAKAEMTKTGTPSAPIGGDDIMSNQSNKSDDVLLAEEIAKANLIDTKSIAEIKDAYSGGDTSF